MYHYFESFSLVTYWIICIYSFVVRTIPILVIVCFGSITFLDLVQVPNVSIPIEAIIVWNTWDNVPLVNHSPNCQILQFVLSPFLEGIISKSWLSNRDYFYFHFWVSICHPYPKIMRQSSSLCFVEGIRCEEEEKEGRLLVK